MQSRLFRIILNLFVIVGLLLPAGLLPSAQAAARVPREPAPTALAEPAPDSGLYRTRVTVDAPSRWTRLEQLDIAILEREEHSAIVLVDGAQLETLARLRFQPQASDELNTLLHAQGEGREWLRTSMQPVIEQGLALKALRAEAGDLSAQATDATISATAVELRAALHSLSVEQQAGIATSISPDSDGDGLTDTEESWWCTDPMNQNSDGDAFDYTDGQEVEALLDFTLHRDVRWNYGPPFGPPNAWPNFNNRDGTGVKVCNDGDFDTIPDYAEAYMVGTSVPDENTDGDKFDDGQELFGRTYCPGGDNTGGYGIYPRPQDVSFITCRMPSWIKPPGDSPFVAAYPVMDMLVDPSTIRVVAKEIKTVEKTITQGEEISTGFAETQGNSTTVGTIDTNEHSTWQENSTTEGGIEPATVAGINESYIEPLSSTLSTDPAIATMSQATNFLLTTRRSTDRCGSSSACSSGGADDPEPILLDSKGGRSLLRLEPNGELAIQADGKAKRLGVQVLTARLLDSGEILYIDAALALKRMSDDGSSRELLPPGSANAPIFVHDNQNTVAYLKPFDYVSDSSIPNTNGIATYNLVTGSEKVLFSWPSVTVRLYGWSGRELVVEVPYWDTVTFQPTKRMVLGALPTDRRSDSIPAVAILPGLVPGSAYPLTTYDGRYLIYDSDDGAVVASLQSFRYGVVHGSLSSLRQDGSMQTLLDRSGAAIDLSDNLLTQDARGVVYGDVPLPNARVGSIHVDSFTPTSVQSANYFYRPVSSNTPVSAYYDLDRTCGTIKDWHGHEWTTECGSKDSGFNYGWSYDQHDGTDYDGAESDYVFAVHIGSVDTVSIDCVNTYKTGTLSWGTTVVLDHGTLDDGAGYKTRYAHLKCDKVDVSGISNIPILPAMIAQMGNTGFSSGAHLHFGVYKNDIPIDPYDSSIISDGSKPVSENSTVICYGPAIESTPAPVNTLPAPQKRTLFGEVIGRLFSGWNGIKTSVSGGWLAASNVTLVSSLPGCGSGTCADQVSKLSNNPLNFSDSKSDGQCGGTGYPSGSTEGGFGGGGAGTAVNDNGDGTWDRLRIWSTTTTDGEGYSTSHSELRSETEYSEITNSQTNTLVSSEAWTTATTVDPTNAGTLTFNYNLYNTGSDYAVRLRGIKLDILIGDLPAITWQASDANDIEPGKAKGDTAGPIILTLEQLAAIDNGAPIRVVLADYDYDDNLYSANAWGRSVLFHVDDGVADGDETIDTYLVTTNLVQGETYQETLARYFEVDVFAGGSADDRNGTLTNIRTPEFDGDGEITGWNDHRVGKNGWWELSISLGGETPGVQHFKDMPAKAKTDVYLRYIEDSDGDGYSDRAEKDAGSDPADPDIHPRPLLSVAQHTETSGSQAMVQLALQNLGNFDASSVEVWAVAADDSITINDNLVGGGGRVRAGGHVVLGARTGNLDLSQWGTSTAKPYADGQYQGLTAKTYQFRADGSGTVGSTNGLTISWSEDGSTWTALAVGSNYVPLTALPLSDGLRVAFTGGYVAVNETFSFQAALPIDTFSYTINRPSPTPPLIVVSYNDPEGNHKFVSHAEVDRIQEDLTQYLGQMRYGFQLDVMANTPYQEGANTAYVVFNNPSDQTIHDANIFVEFATPDGTVAKEYVVSSQTFYPGPNTVEVPWNTADFSPAYDASADYHILAFAADRQGTIFENTVKDLDQVGHDNLPLAILTDSVWDFGEAQQGTLMSHPVAVGNVGYHDLLTFLEDVDGLSLSAQGSRTVAAGDLVFYDLTLNTSDLPVGPFNTSVEFRTSDPENPTRNIVISGEITAAPPDTPGGAVIRPLDFTAHFSDTLTAGTWVTFTHDIDPGNAETLHPVKVYSQDYSTLLGVGEYATDFSAGTASSDMFGDGRDLARTISVNTVDNPIDSICSGSAGSYTLSATNVDFTPNQVILIHQTRGVNAGIWMQNQIAAYTAGAITLTKPLNATYTTGAQVLVLKQYTNVTVNPGVTWSAKAWNGTKGGILGFLATGPLTVKGSIVANAKGFRSQIANTPDVGMQGEGPPGVGGQSSAANGNGGGGGSNGYDPYPDASGAGGGHAFVGGQGVTQGPYAGGTGGQPSGSADLSIMTFGGAGGQNGDPARYQYYGGNGGGIVFIGAATISIGSATGTISSNGESARTPQTTNDDSNSGGGAGGSIFLRSRNVSLGANRVTVAGGIGGLAKHSNGGNGSVGRIRIEYCEIPSAYSTNPLASTKKLDCYIAEQDETALYTTTRLNLPVDINGETDYQTQYGRKIDFAASGGEQTPTIRLPKQIYLSATLDVLVSETDAANGDLNLSLDVGNDGTPDWTKNETTDFPVAYDDVVIVAALNAWLIDQSSVPWGAEVDVPVQVTSNRKAQVLLTNLVMVEQFNQPIGLAAASAVDMSAERPLDVDIVITDTLVQGDIYDFSHGLSPQEVSIHPCKIFDMDGITLKGVGRACTDYKEVDPLFSVFGNSSSSVRTVTAGQTITFCQDTDLPCRRLTVSAASQGQTLDVSSSEGFAIGDIVLVIQMQGSGAGQYEYASLDGIIANSLNLHRPLARDYTVGGNSKVQVIRVPQYSNLTISGGKITTKTWDGSIGGVIALKVAQEFDLSSGSIDAKGKGFRGGAAPPPAQPGTNKGEGQYGQAVIASSGDQSANGCGGGAGDGLGSGGGGNLANGQRGYNVLGSPSTQVGAYGGNAWLDGSLNSAGLGCGGGAGSGIGAGGRPGGSPTNGGSGGNGGGLILISARNSNISSSIIADGIKGEDATGTGGFSSGGAGGGSGGSILITADNIQLGDNLIHALKGARGERAPDSWYGGAGGAGSDGRIVVKYCSSSSGNTTPTAIENKLSCYNAEQLPDSPETTRFYLPDTVNEYAAYILQYGRLYSFGVDGDEQKIHLGRQMYSSGSLDILVSDTGVASGLLNLCIDIGNDGNCDWEYHNATTSFPVELNATGLASAFNQFLLDNNSVEWGEPVDVPVRVEIDRAAQVILTNLALNPVGAKTRFLRLDAQDYADLTLSLQVGEASDGSGPLSFTVDVGANGTIDWPYAGSHSYPATITSPDLSAAFNAYLAVHPGRDVPIRIMPSPSLKTALSGLSATPTHQPDIAITAADINFGALSAQTSTSNLQSSPTEGAPLAIDVTLHNPGNRDSGPLTVSFFATPPDGFGETYIGAAFVENVPASGTTQATLLWNTLGFTGNVPVRVVVDAFDRLSETNEADNEAVANITILTRPDLHIPTLPLSDEEPVAGEAVTVTIPVNNSGQTASGNAVVELTVEKPDGSVEALCQPAVAPAGESEDSTDCTWTPSTPGFYRLYAASDRDNAVNESNEGNNRQWLDVYVGVAGPLKLDSGGANDSKYSPSNGFGYMDEGAVDVIANCGSDSYQTYRRDPDGAVKYRFDHLLTGHFYHLDLVLYECASGASRQEYVQINGNTVAGPINLGDGEVHRLSLLIDPAFYTSRTIVVTVSESESGLGAIVNEIALHDIDYRYADAGSGKDPDYSAERGHGWLDAPSTSTWGPRPFENARVDQADNEIRYRFDDLDPAKRYQLRFTFYQGSGINRVQQIRVNGQTLGSDMTIVSGQTYNENRDVPLSAYSVDNDIIVSVVRTNANEGPLVSEIALEERTQVSASACQVIGTPTRATARGNVAILNQPAPIGAMVTAENPRGDVVGCAAVTIAGKYIMTIYGEDASANPPIPGMREGEQVIFRVDGSLAVATPVMVWQNNQVVWVDLAAGAIQGQSILLNPAWNLFSINLQPPVSTLTTVLGSISGKFCRVLGENGIYDCTVPERFHTLKDILPGQGYYLRLEGGASANLQIQGLTVDPSTPINLHQGWNWIGYLPAYGQPIADALVGIAGDYLWVADGSGLFYDPLYPDFSNLDRMEPGKGYLIYATTNTALIYPNPVAASSSGITDSARGVCADATPTPFYMVLFGELNIGGQPAPTGTTVQALTERGEVAGCFQIETAGKYGFVPIFGADPVEPPLPGFFANEPITLLVDGLAVPLSSPLTWRDDKAPQRLDLYLPAPQRLYLPTIQN